MHTCSVAPASDSTWGKLLPSSPWSCRKLPFPLLPAAILVESHTDDEINCFLSHVRVVCDIILK